MKRSTGFTLIELLVVIAIIAILAAILFPVFATSRERGRMTACMNNLKNLSIACRLYADNYAGKLPLSYIGWRTSVGQRDWCGWVSPANPRGGPDPAKGGGYQYGVDLTQGAIWEYSGRKAGLFLCPTDRNVCTTSPNMRLPSLAEAHACRDCPVSYTMNYLLGRPTAIVADTVRNSTRVLLLIHEGRKHIDDGCFCWGAGNRTLNIPTDIHYNGSTVSYLDGHAKWAPYDVLLKEMDNNYWVPR